MLTAARYQLRCINPLGMTRHELVDLVEQLRRLKGAAAALEGRVTTTINSLDDSGLDGAGVLRLVGRISGRAAARVSATAEMLTDMPLTAAALDSGEITATHADLIASAAKQVSPVLADLPLSARAAKCSADKFAKDCRAWVIDNRPSDEPPESLRAQRSVTDWIGRDGMFHLHAKLDPAAGAVLRSRIDDRTNQLFKDDGGRDASPSEMRTTVQRRADALCGLVEATGAGPRHPKHQITVVADIRRLRSDDPTGAAEMIGSTESVSQSLLERLACDSTFTAVLFDGPGRPLFVGRSHRSTTTAQWTALTARDKGCVGCGADPNRCEAHHIQSWQSNGPTDITNLVLLCSRCHHDVHDRGVELVRLDGRWQVRLRGRRGPSSTGACHSPAAARNRSTNRSSPATREPFTRIAEPANAPARVSPARVSSASPMFATSCPP